LIFTVQNAYSDCVRLLQQREVNRRSVASAQTFVKLTVEQEKAGLLTPLDVFSSEVQLANRRLSLTQTERQIGTAFDQLKRIIDVDLDEVVLVQEDPVDFGDSGEGMDVKEEDAAPTVEFQVEGDENNHRVVLQEYKVSFQEKNGAAKREKVLTPQGEPKILFVAAKFDEEEILRDALENRIELLNSRRQVALRQLNVLLRKDGLGHQIDLTGNYGRSDSGSSFGESHKFRDEDYGVSLNMRIPWGKVGDRAAYERALLDLQQAELQRKQARTQVHYEVRNVLRQLTEQERVLLLLAKQVEQGKRTVKAAQVTFRRGRANAFDVIRAEDDLLFAKVNFIVGRQTYFVRLAELVRVVGKPTGRVELSGQTRGGSVLSKISEDLSRRGLPAVAPDATSDK
jgi:outer membrane protein TolC